MSIDTAKNDGPSKTETLLGGYTVKVAFNVGSSTEDVLVRQLPIKSFPALLAAADDEYKMAELYCDKPSGWAETLTLNSLEAVINEGERVNQDFFSRWVQRRLNRQEKMMPGVTEKVMAAAASVSASQTGLPKSA